MEGQETEMIDPLFRVHMLNEEGKSKAWHLAAKFHGLLREIEGMVPGASREMSIVKTKLEEACFFAKKALANLPENRQ